MNSNSSWTSVFPGTVNGVIDAARWIEDLSAAERFPDDLSFGIQLCVEELFTNAVRHGGGQWVEEAAGSAAPVRMSIGISRSNGVVTVVLEDDGKPFNVAAAPPKAAAGSLEAAEPGGLGIKLVKEFASELTYDHVGGMNRTTLKFLWPQAAVSLL